MIDTANVKNRVQEAVDQIGKTAENAAETVKAAADNMSNRVRDCVAGTAKRAEDVGTFLSDRAGNVTCAVGSRLKAAGDAACDASAVVAHKLQDTGSDIEKKGLGGILNDLVILVKRNPIPAALVGIGLGLLISRGFSRRE